MSELIRRADELIQKIHKLLDKNDKLAADLLEKEEKIRELNLAIKEKSERIRQLEDGLTTLRVAENVSFPEEESKELKKKINEYLRELDRCISKLTAEG